MRIEAELFAPVHLNQNLPFIADRSSEMEEVESGGHARSVRLAGLSTVTEWRWRAIPPAADGVDRSWGTNVWVRVAGIARPVMRARPAP